jgi:hypothetical protein
MNLFSNFPLNMTKVSHCIFLTKRFGILFCGGNLSIWQHCVCEVFCVDILFQIIVSILKTVICRHRFFVAFLLGGGCPGGNLRLRASFLRLRDVMPSCTIRFEIVALNHSFDQN